MYINTIHIIVNYIYINTIHIIVNYIYINTLHIIVNYHVLSLYYQIRQSLDGLLNQMKNFPSRLKNYESYDYVQKLLRGYLKVNMLVTELKSEALKVCI